MHQYGDAPPQSRPRPVHLRRAADDEGKSAPDGLRDPRRLAALQRSVGNRAVAQLLGPTVQRCGSGGGCGPEEINADQGMEGVVEEPPLIAEQTIQRSADGPWPIQRVATFANGTVNQNNNLADTVVNGAPVGVTTPVLNGTITSTGAQFQNALARPTVATTAAATGGFDAEVNTVPTNTGSFNENVLSAGPWRIQTTKAFFHGLFPTVAGCTGPGDTTLRAYGDPDDAAMQTANRRHEDHHAADIRAAFNAIVVPWDQAVTAAKAATSKFHGGTAAEAEAALWTAMGGTPQQIATAFVNRAVADTAAFHATPAGGVVRLSTTKHPGARNHCTVCWLYLVNPS